MTAFVGILLAAGSAQRFGTPKLLHPLHDGVPVAVAAARSLRQALPNTIAVVRPGDHALIKLLTELGLQTVENPQADEGMGSSLAAGVNASAGAAGWVIALADMPWIQATTITALANRMKNGASMVAPVYAGRRGHPVGFSSHWLHHLQRLSGDTGARDLIENYLNELTVFTTEDAGVLEDIDHPQDLSKATK